MKVLGIVLCLVAVLLGVYGQVVPTPPTPCTDNDFYIYNGQNTALRISASNNDVFVCSNTNLCDRLEAAIPFTQIPGGSSVYKTVDGSIYAGGSSTPTDTYDGLTQVNPATNPQIFLWYGSKSAFRAGRFSSISNSATAGNIGSFSVAFGANSEASGQSSSAFGADGLASDYGTTAFGTTIQLGRRDTIPVSRSTIKQDNGILRTGNPILSINSTIGSQATFSAATAFGLSTSANNTASTSFGFATKASGSASLAFGSQNFASGDSATAFGFRTWAGGPYATSWGVQTTANNSRTTAWGYETEALYVDSTAYGWGNTAGADQALVTGAQNLVSFHAATVVGVCNTDNLLQVTKRSYSDHCSNCDANSQPVSTPGSTAITNGQDYAFQVGTGSATDTGIQGPDQCKFFASGLTVMKNGDLYVQGNIYYNVGPDPYQTSDACGCISTTGTGGDQCAPSASETTTGYTQPKCKFARPTLTTVPVLTGPAINQPVKRSVEELSEVAQLKSEIAEMKAQIAQLMSKA